LRIIGIESRAVFGIGEPSEQRDRARIGSGWRVRPRPCTANQNAGVLKTRHKAVISRILFQERYKMTRRERSEFLHLENSNFNTHSNLIVLAEYRGSQLKPDHHSPADAAGRFRTTRWGVVLLSAQGAAEGRLEP
jgi:hypothetical protein